jgi:hypothetical protein
MRIEEEAGEEAMSGSNTGQNPIDYLFASLYRFQYGRCAECREPLGDVDHVHLDMDPNHVNEDGDEAKRLVCSDCAQRLPDRLAWMDNLPAPFGPIGG